MIKPKLSLRVIFIVPFLIIIMLATGIGSFFSLRYGQQSVDEMVSQLQHEIATNVYEHLQDFHAIPSAIVEGNARSIRNGILDLDNPSTLERHFWNQVHIFQGVSPIYMGYAQGGIEMAIWREVEETGRLGKVVKIITSMGKEADAQYMYLTDDFGNRLELVETHPNYDVRNRPWFKAAVERREAGWSPVFTNFGGDALVISRNKPVYGDKGELLAVLCADLNLTHISDFLRGLTIGKTGRAFIIEQSGAVVATSAQEEPLRKQKGDAKPYRINSGESDDPLIRTAARYLMASSWIKDGMTRQAVFERHGKKLMLKVKPFNLENGPDWFIVVVIPMSDFMASINKNRWVTFFLISIAMIFSSVIGFLLADWLTKPIRKLSLAANAATQDEWVQIPETARGNELGELIQAFNQMILQLKDSFGQLRESDDRYKAFMKNSTEQIWCAEFDEPIDIDLPEDEQFDLVYKHCYIAEANDAYARSVGFEHGEELTGTRLEEFCPRSDPQNVATVKAWIRERYMITNAETIESYRDGITRNILNNMTGIIEAGHVTRVWGTAIDITKQRAMEKKLIDAERIYRTVANYTHDWEYWRAPDGRMLYVSPSCERVTGYRPSDFMDDPELMESIILSEDLKVWNAHSHSHENAESADQCQFRIRDKAGDIRWIDHICRPVYDDQGNYAGVRASNREITELKHAEREASEYRDTLALVDRRAMLGQLAGSITHELNQPLTGILSNAQAGEMLLKQGDENGIEIEEILTDIIADSKRSGNILQNLRDLFSGQKTEFKLVDVNAMINETHRILSSEFVMRDLAVHLDLSDPLPDVMGNNIQLQQVMINLINNAKQSIQPSSKGDRSISVITSRGNESEVQVSVEDTGSGVDPDRLESIFEPMSTLKPDGLGLGLSISRSIVEAHGGRIWAENIPAGGARISFTLPAMERKS